MKIPLRYTATRLHRSDFSVRKALADHINSKWTDITADHLSYRRSSSFLSMCCRALALPGDEFLTFAPYFPEYKVYVESAGAALSVIQPYRKFRVDLEKLKRL